FRYGFGVEPRIGRNGFLNIELTAEQVNPVPERVDGVNIVGRLGVFFGYAIARRFTLSAGASLNDLFSDLKDPETGELYTPVAPSNVLWRQVEDGWHHQGWVGWRVAAGVRF
ncbi:MAG: hypothetical protein KDB88_01760, partial [Flavobacteriales bacterium]|nr:hypothetical protein [Flavobacteriales bacterium]